MCDVCDHGLRVACESHAFRSQSRVTMAIGSSGMRTVHGDVGVDLGLSRGGDGGHGSVGGHGNVLVAENVRRIKARPSVF